MAAARKDWREWEVCAPNPVVGALALAGADWWTGVDDSGAVEQREEASRPMLER